MLRLMRLNNQKYYDKCQNIIKNKKGSLSIYLAIFFVVIISASVIFIKETKNRAIESSTKSISSVWLLSELGKYDRHLYEKYGIYGFYGNRDEIVKDINYMANYSFKDKGYIDYQGAEVNLSSNSIANPYIFKQEIVKASKSEHFKNMIQKENRGEDNGRVEDKIDVKVYNKAILGDLPSNGVQSSISISGFASKFEGINSISNLIKRGSEELLVDTYANSFFKNYASDNSLGETVFSNEVEYVICGKHEDEKNRKRVKHYIIGIRQIANTFSIVSNPDMKGRVQAIASLTGAAEGVTEALLIEAWALAESENDYQTLIRGGKIPFKKSSQEWATQIENISEGIKEGYIEMNYTHGEDYNQYLNFFLFMIDEDVKLLRMMDLIQLNMKLNHYDDFLMKEYYVGLDLIIKVNNREVAVSKSYY